MKKRSVIFKAGSFALMGIAAKAIGVFYRIPLTNILGAEGIGLYQAVFPLYAVLLAVCGGYVSGGVAIATAKHKDVKKGVIIKSALLPVFAVSALAVLLLVLLSRYIAAAQGVKECYICYVAIAPALLFTGALSCFRGYFQGRKRMTPYGVSLLIEQSLKLSGLFFAYALKNRSAAIQAAGALLGVALSEAVALLYLIITFLRVKSGSETCAKKPLAKEIFSFAVPVSVGALLTPAAMAGESAIIINLLSPALYGLQTGPVTTLTTLPTVVSRSFANTVMPILSESNLKSKRAYYSAFDAVLYVALASAAAFIFLPKQILTPLYSRGLTANELNTCARLLSVQAISVVFTCFAQITSAILQAENRTKIIARSSLIGAATRIALIYPLVRFFGIIGAALTTVAASAITAIVNVIASSKHFSPLSDNPSFTALCVTSFTIFGAAANTFANALNNVTALNSIFSLALFALPVLSVFPFALIRPQKHSRLLKKHYTFGR